MHLYTFRFAFEYFPKSETPKIYFKTFSYIQKMTLNLIETLKTSICSHKHIKNMEIPFRNLNIFKLSNIIMKKRNFTIIHLF